MVKPITKKYANLSKLGKITTPYGGQTRNEGFHPGVDVANKNGTPIPNMASGVVTKVITGRKNGDNNFGNQVVVKDRKGNSHMYSHLKDIFVRPGQKVKKGNITMTMGDTGASYSPSGGDSSHLDYRIVDAYGKYRDPSKLKTKKKTWNQTLS